MATATFMIISRGDNPIYEAEYGARRDEALHLHQFILHAALDVVQESMWNTTAMNLKTVDKFNDLSVAVYVTAGQARLMLLHDSRTEEQIRLFFTEVHELYIKMLMNPLYIEGAPIAAPGFDSRVRALAKRLLGL